MPGLPDLTWLWRLVRRAGSEGNSRGSLEDPGLCAGDDADERHGDLQATRGCLLDRLLGLWCDRSPAQAVGFAALVLGLEFGLTVARWGRALLWLLGAALLYRGLAQLDPAWLSVLTWFKGT